MRSQVIGAELRRCACIQKAKGCVSAQRQISLSDCRNDRGRAEVVQMHPENPRIAFVTGGRSRTNIVQMHPESTRIDFVANFRSSAGRNYTQKAQTMHELQLVAAELKYPPRKPQTCISDQRWELNSGSPDAPRKLMDCFEDCLSDKWYEQS